MADPDRTDHTHHNANALHGVELMREYFGEACTPPLVVKANGNLRRKVSIRERLWSYIERRCKRGLPKLPTTSGLMPYAAWRDRATELSYHYSGLYRGTYLLNHLLAAAAVLLAALSLVLIILSRTPSHGPTPLTVAIPAWLIPTYHGNNATTMQRMSEALERWGRRMNLAVIIAVAIDIVIVASELCHLLPSFIHPWMAVFAPWLLFLAAVLPAAVAGLNGIRSQSECQRLAERSAVMHAILAGRQDDARPSRRGRLAEVQRLRERIAAAHSAESSNPGAWPLETLHFSE